MQRFPVKSLVHKVLGGGGVYAYIRYFLLRCHAPVSLMRAFFEAQPPVAPIWGNIICKDALGTLVPADEFGFDDGTDGDEEDRKWDFSTVLCQCDHMWSDLGVVEDALRKLSLKHATDPSGNPCLQRLWVQLDHRKIERHWSMERHAWVSTALRARTARTIFAA
jgi:hypothetical protein